MKMMYTIVVLIMKLLSEKYRKQMWLGGLQTSNEWAGRTGQTGRSRRGGGLIWTGRNIDWAD